MSDPRTEQPWYRRWYRQTIGLAVAVVLAICISQRDVPVKYPPAYRQVSNTTIELTSPYSVTCSVGVVELSPGLRSDGASIPARTWGLIGLNPLSGCIIRGALAHDGLYAAHLVNRETADYILLECILADGCQGHKAEVIYQMVRDFGGVAWGRTDDEIAAARQFVTIR